MPFIINSFKKHLITILGTICSIFNYLVATVFIFVNDASVVIDLINTRYFFLLLGYGLFYSFYIALGIRLMNCKIKNSNLLIYFLSITALYFALALLVSSNTDILHPANNQMFFILLSGFGAVITVLITTFVFRKKINIILLLKAFVLGAVAPCIAILSTEILLDSFFMPITFLFWQSFIAFIINSMFIKINKT